MKVAGTRGYVGKKTVNDPTLNSLFLGGIMKSPIVGMGIGNYTLRS